MLVVVASVVVVVASVVAVVASAATDSASVTGVGAPLAGATVALPRGAGVVSPPSAPESTGAREPFATQSGQSVPSGAAFCAAPPYGDGVGGLVRAQSGHATSSPPSSSELGLDAARAVTVPGAAVGAVAVPGAAVDTGADTGVAAVDPLRSLSGGAVGVGVAVGRVQCGGNSRAHSGSSFGSDDVVSRIYQPHDCARPAPASALTRAECARQFGRFSTQKRKKTRLPGGASTIASANEYFASTAPHRRYTSRQKRCSFLGP